MERDMAHAISLELNTKVVQSKDIKFSILKDNSVLGHLLISKGNIEWLPPNKHTNGHRLTWKKFAELMENQGKPVRVSNHAGKKAAKKTAKKVENK